MSTLAIRLRRRVARPTGLSRTRIAAGAMVLVGIGFAAAFAAGAFQSERRAVGSQLCENAFCLTLPAGWTGRTDYGGKANRLIAAPLTVPSWTGNHESEQAAISIPRGRFVIIVWVHGRGYLFGWPRRQTLSISSDQTKLQPTNIVGSPGWAAHSLATLDDRSFEVWVEFRDRHPSESQIASANSVLATLHPAPPPPITK